MRQIVLEQPGTFHERTMPPPRAAEGEALVRIRRVGICGTDLHAFAGRQPFFQYPRVLGHELGVEVVETPANELGINVGDRCSLEPYVNCRICPACVRGRSNCCEKLQVLGVHCDGGMQELFAAPLRLLHKSEKLSLDQLALVETLGIGAHAVTRSGLSAKDDALIIGAGPIGLAVLSFAQITGARIRVMDVSEQRRAFAQKFGAETIAEHDGHLSEVVFDATGNRTSMENCFQYVSHGGRIVFAGLVQGSISFDDPNFHRRETTLLASRNSAGDFPRIIQLIEDGRIDTRPWITHRLELAEVPGRFEAIKASPDLVKAVIEVEDAHD